MRGDGLLDGQLRVTFIDAATTVNQVLVTVPRNGNNTPLRVAALAPFTKVQITGVSRNSSIYGLATRPESVLVELACTAGYRDANGSCENINECVENSDNCSPNANCNDTVGSFYCYCQDGYVGNGVTCTLPWRARLEAQLFARLASSGWYHFASSGGVCHGRGMSERAESKAKPRRVSRENTQPVGAPPPRVVVPDERASE